MWYIRSSTLSAPNSVTNGASRDAHDVSGDSRVPRSASAKMLSFRLGFDRSAFCRTEI